MNAAARGSIPRPAVLVLVGVLALACASPTSTHRPDRPYDDGGGSPGLMPAYARELQRCALGLNECVLGNVSQVIKVTAPGALDLTAAATNALYFGTTQKLCFGAAGSQCMLYGGSNVIQTDTGVGLAVLANLQAQSTSDFRDSIRNLGTGANCSGNTGAVCINDAGGLAIADGSNNTVATISAAGYVASTTPDTLASIWVNGATTGLKGGHKLPAKAFTVTGLSYLDTVASVGGGTAVWTITDGTNTCTATVTCAADAANSANRVVTANGAGTGCVYAASAALTLTLTSATCATSQETFLNVDIEGKWQ